MITAHKSRDNVIAVCVSGNAVDVLKEFSSLTHSLKRKSQDLGLNQEEVNTLLTGAFFKGMTGDFEYEDREEGGLTDDK